MSSMISTGIGDCLEVGIPSRYITKPTSLVSLQGLLNRVPALTGGGKGGNVTSAGWQITLCDPIWHVSDVSSCSSEVHMQNNILCLL